MDSRKIVFQQTGIVALGELIGCAAMILVFWLLGSCDTSVVLGAAVGGVLSVLNFLFMAIGASLAADKAEAQDVSGGKKLIRNSMSLRYIGLFVILFACAKSGLFHTVALVVPLIFVRPALTVAEFFRKKEVA